MTNPLLQKYEELYGKKEEPKPQKTHTDELKERKVISVSDAFIQNVNASVSYNPKPPSLITYDVDSGKDSFLQIAEKVKNKKAQVVSMNMEMGHPIGKCLIPKTLTFEVIVYEDTP